MSMMPPQGGLGAFVNVQGAQALQGPTPVYISDPYNMGGQMGMNPMGQPMPFSSQLQPAISELAAGLRTTVRSVEAATAQIRQQAQAVQTIAERTATFYASSERTVQRMSSVQKEMLTAMEQALEQARQPAPSSRSRREQPHPDTSMGQPTPPHAPKASPTGPMGQPTPPHGHVPTSSPTAPGNPSERQTPHEPSAPRSGNEHEKRHTPSSSEHKPKGKGHGGNQGEQGGPSGNEPAPVSPRPLPGPTPIGQQGMAGSLLGAIAHAIGLGHSTNPRSASEEGGNKPLPANPKEGLEYNIAKARQRGSNILKGVASQGAQAISEHIFGDSSVRQEIDPNSGERIFTRQNSETGQREQLPPEQTATLPQHYIHAQAVLQGYGAGLPTSTVPTTSSEPSSGSGGSSGGSSGGGGSGGSSSGGSGGGLGGLTSAVPALGTVTKALGTAAAVLGVVKDAAGAVTNAREAGAQYQQYLGGSVEAGYGQTLYRRGFEAQQLNTGGLTSSMATQAFNSTTAMGLQGGQRSQALDFIVSNYKSMGMSVSDSLNLVSTAIQNGDTQFKALSSSLQGVSDAAQKAGLSTEQARQNFAQYYGAAAEVSGAGPNANNVANGLSQFQSTLGRPFSSANFSGTQGEQSQMIQAASTGQTYDQYVYNQTQNPNASSQALGATINRFLPVIFGDKSDQVVKAVQQYKDQHSKEKNFPTQNDYDAIDKIINQVTGKPPRTKAALQILQELGISMGSTPQVNAAAFFALEQTKQGQQALNNPAKPKPKSGGGSGGAGVAGSLIGKGVEPTVGPIGASAIESALGGIFGGGGGGKKHPAPAGPSPTAKVGSTFTSTQAKALQSAGRNPAPAPGHPGGPAPKAEVTGSVTVHLQSDTPLLKSLSKTLPLVPKTAAQAKGVAPPTPSRAGPVLPTRPPPKGK